MSRFRNTSAFVAAAAAVAVGLTGCSGGRSVLPTAGSSGAAGAARTSHIRRPGLAQLAHQPPAGMQLAFLMTDGSVLAQGNNSSAWYRYVPDATGDYSDGTWTQVASLPAGYSPAAFASAVRPDGRLLISGGEYNSPGQYDLQLTNLGAVYDPAANTWTPLGHPVGWGFIGDSPASVLADGRFFIGQKLTKQAAVLDSKSLRWTKLNPKGKADFNAEEGFTLLPDGTILTEDVKKAPNAERYNPVTNQWVNAGSTIVDLHSPTPYPFCLTYGPKPKDCYNPPGEIGPAILRPDGTVFASGSGSGASDGVGHTALYHPSGSTGTWTVGPDFPNGDNAGDSYSVLLPSGNVLVFGVSGELYEFDGTKFTTEGFGGGSPILLPTGQVLILGYSASLYTPAGQAQPGWAPTITAAAKTIARGRSYKISGTQFNGLSQGVAFGDEFQNATNYPLVRITNNASGHVFYAKTHDHSSMGVATGSLKVSTHFDVPANADTGASTLQVVANGIASKAVNVTVK
jgi:hypothetical protein